MSYNKKSIDLKIFNNWFQWDKFPENERELLCKIYQENCRIYMDEYPEVEEWDYLPLFDNSLLMKRFLKRD